MKLKIKLLIIALVLLIGYGASAQFSGGTSVIASAPTGGSSYQWYKDGAAIGSATSSTYTIPASAPGVYYATYNDGVCTQTTATFVTMCLSGSNNTAILNASATSGTYQWQSSTDGTTWTNIGSATSSSYTVTAGGIYRVVVTTASGCTVTSKPYYVYQLVCCPLALTPSPTVTTTNDNSCTVNNGSIQFKATGMFPATSYQVSYVKDAGAATAYTAYTSASDTTITISSLGAGAYTSIKVRSASDTTCTITIPGPYTLTGATNPASPSNTTSTVDICETSTKALSATPSGGAWSIVSGGGSISGTIYTPANVSATTAVTVRYTMTGTGGCTLTSDATFNVNDNVGAATNTTSTADICETTTKTLAGTPSGGTWSIVSGGGSISGTTYTPANVSATTAVTVRYTIPANGACAATTADATFNVNDNVGTATNTTSVADLCETTTKALTGTPSGGTWSIVSGGGSISGTTYTPANVSATTAVTVRYTIPANGACAATTADVTFNVNDNAGTAANTTSTANICETTTKSLTGTPSGGTWSIVSGGGSISGTIYTPANVSANTSVTIRYTIPANGACAATTADATFIVNVDNGTAANTTSTADICETATKALSGAPAGGSWSVVSGGGSISGTTYTPANVSATTAVTVRYTMPVNGGCTATTADATFNVNEQPTSTGITSTNPTTCTGTNGSITISGMQASMNYSVTYTGPSGSTTVSLTSNAGGQLTIPSLAVGTYSNILITRGGCSSTALGPVTLIGPAPTGSTTINCK